VSRQSDLLKAAADALDDGRSPLEGAFLGDHGVTLDELFDLAERLSIGARLVAWAIENPKLAGAAASGASDAMRMDVVIGLLRKLDGEGERS
jgi:hypothetical protein